MRGDGKDIPAFFILGQYANASYASGRRPDPGVSPVSGMNLEMMKAYVDHLNMYVEKPSLLLLDKLSSHTSKKTLRYIESFQTINGRQKFVVKYFPTKTPFLVSPLDNSLNALFKKNFYRYDRSTLEKKEKSAYLAWREVSNENIRSYFDKCGLVGKRSLKTLEEEFMKDVRGSIPEKNQSSWEFYEAWKSQAIEVEGVLRSKGSPLEIPTQLPEGELDGRYWVKYQGVKG